MTHEEIATMIAGIGLPNAYDHFEKEEAVDPPFICFLYPGRSDFYADGTNYMKITDLRIELYTDNEDFEYEEAVESALESAEIVYSKLGPSYINTERMYVTTYEMSVRLDPSETATTEEAATETEVAP